MLPDDTEITADLQTKMPPVIRAGMDVHAASAGLLMVQLPHSPHPGNSIRGTFTRDVTLPNTTTTATPAPKDTKTTAAAAAVTAAASTVRRPSAMTPAHSSDGGQADDDIATLSPSSSRHSLSLATIDGECLACGYHYACMDELAHHQRTQHGLSEVIL